MAFKTQIAGVTPVSDSVGLRWGPVISISNKIPSDADAAAP